MVNNNNGLTHHFTLGGGGIFYLRGKKKQASCALEIISQPLNAAVWCLNPDQSTTTVTTTTTTITLLNAEVSKMMDVRFNVQMLGPPYII